MLEPDVTITDYILAVQAAFFAVTLFRQTGLTAWFFLFFALCIASFAGGTVHGFFPDEASLSYNIVWKTTLLSLGVVALAGAFASTALFSPGWALFLKIISFVQFLTFAAIVISHSQKFLLAAVNYLPASMLLMLACALGYSRTRAKPLLFGVLGVILTFVGSYIQIRGVSLHPVYFNHNAFYHVVQFFAVFLLFDAAKWMTLRGKTDHEKRA